MHAFDIIDILGVYMRANEEIKHELDELIDDGNKVVDLIQGNIASQCFTLEYQDWYTRAIKLVTLLGNDRLRDFNSYYLPSPNRTAFYPTNYVIRDYICGADYRQSSQIITSKFIAQLGIIKSLFSRIDSVLSDVEGHLFAELQDEELRTASRIIEINIRAAGAIAGVVLEKHLQRVAVNHRITISKKDPTISDLNEPLRRESIYDVPTWRQIQVLADIRNLCDHSKAREPTEAEVRKLIQETDIVKNLTF
jgi:hypothetical protein